MFSLNLSVCLRAWHSLDRIALKWLSIQCACFMGATSSSVILWGKSPFMGREVIYWNKPEKWVRKWPQLTVLWGRCDGIWKGTQPGTAPEWNFIHIIRAVRFFCASWFCTLFLFFRAQNILTFDLQDGIDYNLQRVCNFLYSILFLYQVIYITLNREFHWIFQT